MNKNILHISHKNISIYIDTRFENIEEFSNQDTKITLIGEIYTEKNTLIDILKSPSLHNDAVSSVLQNVEGKFILIRKTSDSLILINDKLGLKPLYISKNNPDIIITNTLEMYTMFCEKVSLSKRNIIEFLEFGFLGGGKTLFQDLENMNSGTIKTFGILGNTEAVQYYNLKPSACIPTTQQLGEIFKKGVEIRVLDTNTIRAHLSGGYDTRYILGNLLSLGHKDTIDVYSSESSQEDCMIAQEVATHFDIRFHTIPANTNTSYYHYNNVKDGKNWDDTDIETDFSGLGGGELLGNSMRDSWFLKNDIGTYIQDKTLLSEKKYTRDIETFVGEICRTSVNTIQGLGWTNPSLFGMGGHVLPFFDSKFLEGLTSLPRKELEGYKTYKNLYRSFFPEGKNFHFTYCFERDGVKKDTALFHDDTLITNNYHISKIEIKKILQVTKLLYQKHAEFLDTFLHKDIIGKIPLEMLLVLISLEKSHTKKHIHGN